MGNGCKDSVYTHARVRPDVTNCVAEKEATGARVFRATAKTLRHQMILRCMETRHIVFDRYHPLRWVLEERSGGVLPLSCILAVVNFYSHHDLANA